MNSILHKITYPTFRILLLDKLFETIYPRKDVPLEKVFSPQRQDEVFQKIKLSSAEIPLKQVKNTTSLAAYQSAIALKLTAGSLRDARSLGYQVVQNFHISALPGTEDFSVVQRILREFTVNVTEAGYLEFALSDRGLAIWLRFLLKEPPQVPFAPQTSRSQLPENDLFLCQHTHARCVTLISLVKAARVCPKVNEVVQGEWCLRHPTEQDLVFLTISVLDALYDASAIISSQTILKWAIALTQAFRRFDSACRILGKPSSSRLGLVVITQNLLKSLLQEGLSVCVPFEL